MPFINKKMGHRSTLGFWPAGQRGACGRKKSWPSSAGLAPGWDCTCERTGTASQAGGNGLDTRRPFLLLTEGLLTQWGQRRSCYLQEQQREATTRFKNADGSSQLYWEESPRVASKLGEITICKWINCLRVGCESILSTALFSGLDKDALISTSA